MTDNAVSAIRPEMVKPLVWTTMPNGALAHTPFGNYEISTGENTGSFVYFRSTAVARGLPSEDAARAAAQADYASRILSALDPAFIERMGALETEAEELKSHLIAVLKRDEKWAPSGVPNDCGCIGISRDAEHEYEMGMCPHQLAREVLARTTQESTNEE
jgi:hypothetical protein